MKPRLFFTALLSAASLATFSQATLAAEQGNGAKSGEATKTKRALEKGMTEAEVIALIGKPASVEKLESPEGKAERWDYRRKLNEQVIQTANTQILTPALVSPDGRGPLVENIVTPDYRLKYIVTYQNTVLLMFDGKLVFARQWQEQDESFAN